MNLVHLCISNVYLFKIEGEEVKTRHKTLWIFSISIYQMCTCSRSKLKQWKRVTKFYESCDLHTPNVHPITENCSRPKLKKWKRVTKLYDFRASFHISSSSQFRVFVHTTAEKWKWRSKVKYAFFPPHFSLKLWRNNWTLKFEVEYSTVDTPS